MGIGVLHVCLYVGVLLGTFVDERIYSGYTGINTLF